MNARFSILATAAALLLAAHSASAVTNEYNGLIKARKYDEAERAINARLSQDATNSAALNAKVRLILETGDPSRLEDAVKAAEQCVAAHPNEADCHEMHGEALGSKAMNAGIMSAIGYATTIRDEFKKAMELDPRNLAARFSLQQYFLQAPGIVGGGAGKAKALAAETAKLNPEAGKIMQAQLDMNDDRFASSEAITLSVQAGADEAVADNQRDLLLSLATHYLVEKKYADSERLYREIQKRFPDSEWATYGIARTMQEQGRHQEAVPIFEKALTLAQRAQIYYRIGVSQQALNDKVKALSAFEKALSFKFGLVPKTRSFVESQVKALKA